MSAIDADNDEKDADDNIYDKPLTMTAMMMTTTWIIMIMTGKTMMLMINDDVG